MSLKTGATLLALSAFILIEVSAPAAQAAHAASWSRSCWDRSEARHVQMSRKRLEKESGVQLRATAPRDDWPADMILD